MKRIVMLLAIAVIASACGDQSVFSMDVGLCFDDEADATDEVSSVPDRDCSEPHDNEVFALFQLDEGTFPGQDAVFEQAQDLCTGSAFEEYVGIAYLDSELDVFPLTPTETGWADGDHEVVCALYALDQSKLESSMKGASR